MSTMIPVVLSGGAGTRLWPLSRAMHPKQFHAFTGKHTLIQETVLRIRGAGYTQAPLVLCNEAHRFMVAGQLDQIGAPPERIVLEPVARGTAPALAAAAQVVQAAHDDAVMAVFPADHLIGEERAFRNALQSAVALAEDNHLVTFGVAPRSAHTGYGYLRTEANPQGMAAPVLEFVEKPDAVTAQSYLEQGGYFWNSGMFVFRASVLLEAFAEHAPIILSHCTDAVNNAKTDECFLRLGESDFALAPDDSIDYAVMEKAMGSMMVPLDAGWNDIGSWNSLWAALDKDNDNNANRGEVLNVDTSDSLVISERALVATLGVRNLAIVDTPDALLVADRDHTDKLKALVATLSSRTHKETQHHRKVYRPWGSFDGVEQGEGFQVKKITVDPGKKLSLQRHQHRAEHWIVVRGRAEVTVANDTFVLEKDQSTYIPIGTVHRLANVFEEPLEIIEVQTGAYLGEDDIERLEDDFHRQSDD